MGCYSFKVCSSCHASHEKRQKDEANDPKKFATFLRCSSLSCFTLQVPPGGGAHPGTGNFAVTLDVRFTKLPGAGQLQSLLRFSLQDTGSGAAITTSFTAGAAGRAQLPSVYVNSEGVVAGEPLASDVEAALPKEHSSKSSKSAASQPSPGAAGPGGALGGGGAMGSMGTGLMTQQVGSYAFPAAFFSRF